MVLIEQIRDIIEDHNNNTKSTNINHDENQSYIKLYGDAVLSKYKLEENHISINPQLNGIKDRVLNIIKEIEKQDGNDDHYQ